MIEARSLSKSYGSRSAVADASFSVADGETVALLGKNGAGKTTVMRMLTCFMPPSAGTAMVAGFDIHKDTQKVRQHIGYLPETPPVYPNLSVEDYLGFCAQLKKVPKADIAARIKWAMEKTDITDMAERFIGHLSKGYRQRVGLAQALVNKPKVLILDEPTVGMDPTQIREIRDLITGLKGESTTMLSTHILEEASAVCDRIVIIHGGRVAADGSFEELQRKAHLERQIDILVRGEEEELLRQLQEFRGVSKVDLQRETLEPEVRRLTVHTASDSDMREALFLLAAKSGARILGFMPHKATLEEVFLSVTHQEEISDTPSEEEASQ